LGVERAQALARLEGRAAAGHGLLDRLLGLVGEPALAQALGLRERAESAQLRGDRAFAAEIARAHPRQRLHAVGRGDLGAGLRQQRLQALRFRRHGGGT
jgi:hypothetical protein